MKYNKFIDVDRAIDALYEEKKYEESLELLEEALKVLPKNEIKDNYFTIIWVKTVLYTMCKRYDECFEEIKQIVNEGYAFPIHFKRFEPLKKKSGYEELKAKNDKMLDKLKANTKAKYVVHLPANYNSEKKYPLFIALHGDGISNMQELSGYWKPDVFIENNFIFAYIQSSQVVCHNGHGWLDDTETARRDIKDCYDSIAKKYLIDESSILIGGFSGGAITSVDFTMSHIFPIKGFIALCPEIKPEAFTKKNVRLAAQRGIKGVFMEGELVLPMESEEEMIKTFDEVGLPYEYYINKGVGHCAPKDFDDKLRKALKFILE
ncbi:hypothetical protein R9X47_24215 [Wukongibacter baidiensis]|uniref:alpha/beta hydrolase n=1 Tax=Wukongibacter baidiensis TaxID=1723361 RepID=UPI003D7F6FED